MFKKLVWKIAGVILLGAIVFGMILWMVTGPETLVGVAVPKTDEPYVAPADYPKDTTLLMGFPDGYAVAVELCFAKGTGRAVLLNTYSETLAADYGFFVQHTWQGDYTTFIELIDCLGGLSLTEGDETYCCTGVQVCRELTDPATDESRRLTLLKAAFSKIYKTGFSSEALSCIIEKGQTDLCVPVCFDWTRYLPRVCGAIHIINEG